jgi:hypothetical protein
VVEIAEEFVEAVHAREKFIPVAQMVLAELRGGIPLGFQNVGTARVLWT